MNSMKDGSHSLRNFHSFSKRRLTPQCTPCIIPTAALTSAEPRTSSVSQYNTGWKRSSVGQALSHLNGHGFTMLRTVSNRHLR